VGPALTTQFDLPQVQHAYANLDNFRCVPGRPDSPDRCFVFFSGNGLYFPNTKEEFERRILREDRYEWIGLCPPPSTFRKAIFLRDVRKTWYVDGISARLDSIEKVVELLRVETAGFSEVVCVGNSAGGFAAALFGREIGAHAIYSFSGYFDLSSEVGDPANPGLAAAALDVRKQPWLSLGTRSVAPSAGPILHFAPVGSCIDRRQLRAGRSVPATHSFRLALNTHGQALENAFYPSVLTGGPERILRLSSRNPDKIWRQADFTRALVGRWGRLRLLALAGIRKAARRFTTSRPVEPIPPPGEKQ